MLLTSLISLINALTALASGFVSLTSLLCIIDDMLGLNIIPDSVCDSIPSK